MKLFLQNHCGTIYRADKLKWLKPLLPTATDISRRLILCQKANLSFQPYKIVLDKKDFAQLLVDLKDGDFMASPYLLFTNDNTIICKIYEHGTDTETGEGASQS